LTDCNSAKNAEKFASVLSAQAGVKDLVFQVPMSQSKEQSAIGQRKSTALIRGLKRASSRELRDCGCKGLREESDVEAVCHTGFELAPCNQRQDESPIVA